MFVFEIVISIVSLLLILIFLYFLYKNYKLHKSRPLELYIQAAAGIFSIIFSSAAVLQVLSYNRERKVEVVKDYENLAKEFYNDTIQLFIDNDDMDYYFNNLFHNQPIPAGTVRNPTKEREITYLIFSKLGTITSYETIMDSQTKKFLDEWIIKIVGNFIRSDIFRGYWKDYKNSFGGYLSSIYMKEHFNI